MKRKSFTISLLDKVKIVDFYQKGNTLNTSAQNFKTSVNIIRQILKEFSIKVRTITETKKLKRNSQINLLQNEFINKAVIVHNNYFTYCKVIYENSLNKVIITCPIHGDFLQTPGSHINGQGCIKCSLNRNSLASRSTNEEFIEKSMQKHGNYYDYSKVNYIKSNEKVFIICPLHGEFKQKPNQHLAGSGCTKCGYERNSFNFKMGLENFIKKAEVVHGNLYDYSKAVYGKDNKKKVEIICKNHGSFWQTPNDHLSSNAKCPKCNLELNTRSKTGWIDKGKGRTGIFYIIKCWNENEKFYKIGITFNSVQQRYKKGISMPYKWEILREIKSKDLEYIWNLEVENKRKLRKYSYKPLIYFAGETECFDNISEVSYIKSRKQILKELPEEQKQIIIKEWDELDKLISKFNNKQKEDNYLH